MPERAVINFETAKLVAKGVILSLLGGIAFLALYWLLFASNWSWLPTYLPLLVRGLYYTILLLVVSCALGIALAVPIGLVQVTGPAWLALPARWFCTIIRGTPLLLQVWLIYYGLGSLFPLIPELRQSFLWPVLREGLFYAMLSFTLSFAGYEGEVMRGAFLGVPRGELEAARAFGMSPWKVLTRVWLPRAFRIVLPTLAGETLLQLKSTPLAFTVTVMDLMGVTSRIRQDTFRIFEPLILLSVIYMCLTYIIVWGFTRIERMVPVKR